MSRRISILPQKLLVHSRKEHRLARFSKALQEMIAMHPRKSKENFSMRVMAWVETEWLNRQLVLMRQDG
jgi:hypothetical protein